MGGVVLGFVAASTSGCYVVGAVAQASSDCPPLKSYCSGDSVVNSTYVTSDDCGITESYETDCSENGGRCVDGACVAAPAVPPKNPCPGGNGECRGEVAFACTGGGLPDVGEDCAAQGLRCLTFLPWGGNRIQAACVLSSERCGVDLGEAATECRNDEIVRCRDGFPVEATACEGPDVRCVDYDQYSAIAQGAHCTFSVACPPDGGTFCRDNVVYGCDGGDSTVQLRDCGTGVCVERNGQGMCASSTTAPVLRFVPIPGGTFRATWDEPEVTFGDFEMLEREVTWSEYGACVAAGACAPPSSECTLVDYQRSDLHADLPVTCIDLPQARAFCATLGARVPTTDEWRYALSNASAEYQFPCAPGDVPCEDTIRRSLSRPCGVDEPMVGCAVGDDVSTQGVCDLLGNVTELVEHTPGSGVPARCGVGPGCGDARIDLLGPHQIGTLMPLWSVGFRCVR